MSGDPRALLRRALGLRAFADDVETRWSARHTLSLALIGTRPGERVLDVGTSFGWLEQAGPGKTGAAFVGIEPDARSLALARRNAPGADIRAGSALALPFDDASFDGATMFEVLEHVPRGSELAALREIRRVLRPDGWFVLSTPYDDPRAKLLDPAFYLGHRHYGEARLRALFAEAGFAVTRLFVRGGWWECGAMLALYACKALAAAELPAPAKRALERGREREFCGERAGFTNVFCVARAA